MTAQSPIGGVSGSTQMSAPTTKLSVVVDAMRAGDWTRAIKLAAKFPRLGEEKAAIMRAHEAILRPDFQRALGKDVDRLIEAGKAALLKRYGKHV